MSGLRGFLIILAGIVAALGLPQSASADGCEDLDPLVPDASAPNHRAISTLDLVQLRDLGPVSAMDVTSPILSISPNGRQVAFQLRRAEPAQNTYCLGMFVLSLDGSHGWRIVDRGGELIRQSTNFLGQIEIPTGLPLTIKPKWSPDGKWIAFLRKDAGPVELWVARADGSLSKPVTNVEYNVTDYEWAVDGKGLVFSGSPDTSTAQVERQLSAEALQGYHFDNRHIPIAGPAPFPASSSPVVIQLVDLMTGEIRPATYAEEALLRRSGGKVPTAATIVRSGLAGRVAWLAAANPDDLSASEQLHFLDAHQVEKSCDEEACRHVKDLWISETGESIYYLRRQGVALSDMGLYQWSPGSSPRYIMGGDAALSGCQISAAFLVCVEQSALKPKHIVEIDLKSGGEQTIFEPNPEFDRFDLGEVRRLYWRNNIGIETFGDLVLPPGYRGRGRVPLILVGYDSRGFLRGGTGDEYPILPLAAQGFAVLRYERPLDYGLVKGAKSVLALEALNREDWADKKSVLSALEEGVKAAVSTGHVDSARVGLTGFSDGATSAQYAVLNSKTFSAIVLSDCCDDPGLNTTFLGLPMANRAEKMGYPLAPDSKSDFWNGYSLSLNADHVATPILIQAPDDEYLLSLPALMALRHAKKPVDLFIYPDEYHNKWQPAHRLSIYNRTIQWFTYWFMDKPGSGDTMSQQFKDWDELFDRPH